MDTYSIKLTTTPYLNLPLLQNSVPIVKHLSVTAGPGGLASVTKVRLSSEPRIFEERLLDVGPLLAAETVDIQISELKVNNTLLAELVESMPATITVEPVEGGLAVAERAHLRLLPASHWGGSSGTPALIGAHVYPNDPAVQAVLRRAGEQLRQKNLSLSGYQAETNREVATQVLSVLSAFKELELNYANPPASFEDYGQKVRTPSEQVHHKLSTCLDSTVFLAAALEQAGLHTVIVFLTGHAYLAVWLQESPCTQAIISSALELRKALRNGLLMAIETTALTGGQSTVEKALSSARESLLSSEKFQIAVDLYLTRKLERIRPFNVASAMASDAQNEAFPTSARHDKADTTGDLLADIPEINIHQQGSTVEKVPTGTQRIVKWKGELLDLSRRNKLLNWRPTGGALHLKYVDGAILEDALADGATFTFDSVSEGQEDRYVVTRKMSSDYLSNVISQAQAKKLLTLTETPGDLERSLKKLSRSSRKSLEEGGANTLYLAIGFVLKPFAHQQTVAFHPRAKGPERAEYIAPLLLLPVALTRRGVNGSWKLKARDEDAMLNPTLLQLLRNDHDLDFGELSQELPQDDSGLDVRGILAIVRNKLLNVSSWEVIEEVVLGEFSFSKYLMWRDLDAFEPQLRENPVVAHLIDHPREAYHDPADQERSFPRTDRLDESFPAKDMVTPLSADSSQLAAIRAAAQGWDFVLEGPPGTGKSQTITNLIAQCVAEGKTVLFVSEKTAALEVVERRLKSIGLGERSLELHSTKVSKTLVYDQFRRALRANKVPGHTFPKTAAAYGQARARLNARVHALHRASPIGPTVFQMAAFIAAHPAVPAPEPPPELIARLDTSTFNEGLAQVRQLSLRYAELKPELYLSMYCVRRIDDGWNDLYQQAEPAAVAYQQAMVTFDEALGLPSPLEGQQVASRLELASLLLDAEGQDLVSLAEMVSSGRVRRSVVEEIGAVREITAAFQGLSGSYQPSVMDMNVRETAVQWQSSEAVFVLLRWYQQFMMRRQIKLHIAHAPQDYGADLQQLSKIHEQRGALDLLGADFSLQKDAISKLEWRADWAASLVEWSANQAEATAVTSEQMARWLDDIAEENNRGKAILQHARQVLKDAQAITDLSPQLDGYLIREYLPGTPTGPWAQYPAALSSALPLMKAFQGELRYYRLYADTRESLRQNGFGFFVDAAPESTALTDVVTAVNRFRLSIYQSMLRKMLRDDPLLDAFTGANMEDLMARFSTLDEELQRASSLELQSRLAERRKKLKRKEFSKEMGLLKQELQKKRRQLPVRQLLLKINKLLPELMPCVLMSPLSIAQYLPAGEANVHFDVVVFDEASQIPVWDAIGAIARGKQVIVVGDSKQLPPTSFFSKSQDEDETDYFEDDLVMDMESILDEMKAAQLKTWRLRWHYRSRAESLITFSNRTYYDGKLNTFPAPSTSDMAVQFHKVDAHSYHKGTNKAEARQLVAYLINRLEKDPTKEMTYGVVTFSQAQQTLIEDLLEEARSTNSVIEPHFDGSSMESVFVKNIESVQGDERDVILFSITYGPNEDGRLSMRFGPMNQAGGERRLNVAITRARQEMHLFSTMEPEQIDLKRLGENAQGARDLRHFMKFARDGAPALTRRIESVGAYEDFESPVELAVATALREEGFVVDPQVGVSDYRIDLGVRHPDKEGHYLLGIECDGASYHSSPTARDRDILRQRVLEGLGWQILRVWSIDWFHDRQRTLDRLLKEIRQIESTGERTPTPLEPEPLQLAEPSPAIPETQASAPNEQLEKPSEPSSSAGPAARTASPIPIAQYQAPAMESDSVEEPEQAPAEQLGVYESADLAKLRQNLVEIRGEDALKDLFYDGELDLVLIEISRHLLKVESPIFESLAIRKISTEVFHFSGSGSKIKTIIARALATAGIGKSEGGETVYYAQPEQAIALMPFRKPNPGEADSRSIHEIPQSELVYLAKHLMNRGLTEERLVRSMATEIGIKSLRKKARHRLNTAIQTASEEEPPEFSVRR